MFEKINIWAVLPSDSPWKLVAKLSAPIIVGMVVVGPCNFIDGVYVGQMIEDRAMTAVSVSYPFTLANIGIPTLIGAGSASILSEAVGKKDQAVIDKIMGNLVTLNLIFPPIIMAGGVIFTRQILMLSGAKGEILSLTTRYLRIIFAGSLFVSFVQSANMTTRDERLLKRATMFSADSVIMNIILDPVFILFLSPYGRGIDGAAHATILSQVVHAATTSWYLKKKGRAMQIHVIRIEKDLFYKIISVGVSAMLMQIMMLVQQTVLYNLAAQHGGNIWQIILEATYRATPLTFIPLWGLSQRYQPAVGTSYGAEQYGHVRYITKIFSITAALLAFIFYLPIMTAPKATLSMSITTLPVTEQGAGVFHLFFISFILLSLRIAILTLVQSLGRVTEADVSVILRQIVLYIPAAITMSHVTGPGIHGIFTAPVIMDATILIAATRMAVSEFKRMDGEP